MFVEDLSEIKAGNSDVAISPPLRKNGEPQQLLSISVGGTFVIVRYYGTEPIAGPSTEHFYIDIFYNQYGREVFRAISKLRPVPDDPDTLGRRIKQFFKALLR